MDVQIVLNSDATAAEIAAVRAVAQEEGLRGPIEATWSSRGFEQFPWILCLLVPLGLFFSQFFSGMGQEAGKDAYREIRRLIARLYGARRDSNGCVEMWDKDTKTHIILTADLPEEAYAKLGKIGFSQLKGGYWTWDPGLGEWNRM